MGRARSPEDARARALAYFDRALGPDIRGQDAQRRAGEAAHARVRPHLGRWEKEFEAAFETVLRAPGPRALGPAGRRFCRRVERAAEDVDVRFAVQRLLQPHVRPHASVAENRHVLAEAAALPLQRLVHHRVAAERSAEACIHGAGWLPQAMAQASASWGSEFYSARCLSIPLVAVSTTLCWTY